MCMCDSSDFLINASVLLRFFQTSKYEPDYRHACKILNNFFTGDSKSSEIQCYLYGNKTSDLVESCIQGDLKRHNHTVIPSTAANSWD